MNKKILVISWFFPPVNSSEGLVTYKLLKASKYDYDVFTQKNSELWSYGKKDVFPECKNINSIFTNAKNIKGWMDEAIEYYRQNKDKYDIVMTRSMPPESHKIGLEIKNINPNIIWIASFGDPISNNPYTKLSITYNSPYSSKECASFKGIISPKRIIKNTIFNIRYKRLHRVVLNADKKLEESIMKKCDYVIFNNIYQKEYMIDKYDENVKNKAIILDHSFDEELYPKVKTENDKVKFTYIGHLDKTRNPFMLFSAIRELNLENPDLADKVVFEFYGNMSDQDKLFIINYELTDIIKIKRPVSYIKSLEIMQSSDWLVLIDANLSSIVEKNIFFAAKLADYIGTGNKIFGITMQEGISADILRNLNAVCTSYSQEEIKNYLWLIIYGDYKTEIDEKARNEFNSTEVAKKFDDLISSLK